MLHQIFNTKFLIEARVPPKQPPQRIQAVS